MSTPPPPPSTGGSITVADQPGIKDYITSALDPKPTQKILEAAIARVRKESDDLKNADWRADAYKPFGEWSLSGNSNVSTLTEALEDAIEIEKKAATGGLSISSTPPDEAGITEVLNLSSSSGISDRSQLEQAIARYKRRYPNTLAFGDWKVLRPRNKWKLDLLTLNINDQPGIDRYLAGPDNIKRYKIEDVEKAIDAMRDQYTNSTSPAHGVFKNAFDFTRWTKDQDNLKAFNQALVDAAAANAAAAAAAQQQQQQQQQGGRGVGAEADAGDGQTSEVSSTTSWNYHGFESMIAQVLSRIFDTFTEWWVKELFVQPFLTLTCWMINVPRGLFNSAFGAFFYYTGLAPKWGADMMERGRILAGDLPLVGNFFQTVWYATFGRITDPHGANLRDLSDYWKDNFQNSFLCKIQNRAGWWVKETMEAWEIGSVEVVGKIYDAFFYCGVPTDSTGKRRNYVSNMMYKVAAAVGDFRRIFVVFPEFTGLETGPDTNTYRPGIINAFFNMLRNPLRYLPILSLFACATATAKGDELTLYGPNAKVLGLNEQQKRLVGTTGIYAIVWGTANISELSRCDHTIGMHYANAHPDLSNKPRLGSKVRKPVQAVAPANSNPTSIPKPTPTPTPSPQLGPATSTLTSQGPPTPTPSASMIGLVMQHLGLRDRISALCKWFGAHAAHAAHDNLATTGLVAGPSTRTTTWGMWSWRRMGRGTGAFRQTTPTQDTLLSPPPTQPPHAV